MCILWMPTDGFLPPTAMLCCCTAVTSGRFTAVCTKSPAASWANFTLSLTTLATTPQGCTLSNTTQLTTVNVNSPPTVTINPGRSNPTTVCPSDKTAVLVFKVFSGTGSEGPPLSLTLNTTLNCDLSASVNGEETLQCRGLEGLTVSPHRSPVGQDTHQSPHPLEARNFLALKATDHAAVMHDTKHVVCRTLFWATRGVTSLPFVCFTVAPLHVDSLFPHTLLLLHACHMAATTHLHLTFLPGVLHMCTCCLYVSAVQCPPALVSS